MFKNKALLIAVVGLFATGLCVSTQPFNDQFEVRGLNYQDSFEIDETCKIFEDQQTREMTWHPYSIRSMIKDVDMYKTVICKRSIEDKNICGVLIYSIDAWDKSFAQYNVLAVHKDYRRQGIALKLMDYVEKCCFKQKINKFWLCAFIRNKVAINCYKKNGFYVPWYCRLSNAICWGEDSLIMVKKI